MACGEGSLSQRLEKANTHQVSLLSLTFVLALSGVIVLVWMAAAGWQDITGIIVGVIFVVLTGLQVAFAVTWWKSQSRTAQEYSVQQEESMTKGEASINNSDKAANNMNGDDARTGLLVTDEVKVAYTDGAQKIDHVEMVSV